MKGASMSRRSLIVLVVVAVLAIAALRWAFAPPAVAVETAPVTRGLFVQTIEDDGVTRVRDRYVVSAPVSGTLLRPELRVGDAVRADRVVATILPSVPEMLDPRTRAELLARLGAAEARHARAGAMVKQAQAALVKAEADAKRITDLAAQGFVSRTESERATLELDIRRRELEAARFEQDAALHDLQQARAAVGRGTENRRPNAAWQVRSPVAGAVLSVVRESEGFVAVGAPIMEIGDLGRLEAIVDVLSTEATQIERQAPVALVAGNGVRLAGRVREIAPAARTEVSALGVEEQRVDVYVDLLPNPTVTGKVGDGYRVDAAIEVARVDDAVQVPVAALFRSGEQWAVFRIKEDRAALVPVTLGLRGRDRAVVREGLGAADVVVIYPSDSLRDGARVEIRKRR
jgi:HlyD family secretion protein